MTWNYVRAGVHDQGKFVTFGNERGSITENPVEACRRYLRQFEEGWKRTHPDLPPHLQNGSMWAVWEFPAKPTLDEARKFASTYRPTHLLVSLSADVQKNTLVRVLLHPQTAFDFHDYSMEGQ